MTVTAIGHERRTAPGGAELVTIVRRLRRTVLAALDHLVPPRPAEDGERPAAWYLYPPF